MTNMDHRPESPHYRTPASIRDETFQRRRMGGLDADRVYAYLDVLADQVQAAEERISRAVEENERLRGELKRVQGELDEYEQVGDRVNDQVVELFSQAQLVAEEMVQDVSRDARERIGHARAHERKIVEEALDAAGQQVTSYARSTQAQLQSLVNSFASEVDRLGIAPPAGDRGPESEPAWEPVSEPVSESASEPVPELESDRELPRLRDPLFDAWNDPLAPTRNGSGPGASGSADR